MDNIVEAFLRELSDENESKSYQKRISIAKDWHQNRKITDFSVGIKVDIRSPEYVWCSGIIRKIHWRMDTNLKIMLVHYEGSPNIYDEEIWEGSVRLAAHK